MVSAAWGAESQDPDSVVFDILIHSLHLRDEYADKSKASLIVDTKPH